MTDVTLNEYTDGSLSINTPIKYTHITEPRSNVQEVLSALDAHQGSTGDEHALATHEKSGFMDSELLVKLADYEDQLKDLEELIEKIQIPAYSIAVWNGNADNIPVGWALCNGSNKTPDLRYRIPVNWGTDVTGITAHDFFSTGGGFSTAVSASTTSSHTHTFYNLIGGSWAEAGVYTRYTDKGSVSKVMTSYDWDNYPIVYTQTSGTAGSASTTQTVTVNLLPPYNVKWYIMKIPTVTDTTSYKIIVTAAANSVTKTVLGSTTYTGDVDTSVKYSTNIKITVTPTSRAYRCVGIKKNGILVGNASSSDVNTWVYEGTCEDDMTFTATMEYIPRVEYSYTSNSSVTIPAYISVVRVAMCGGGGGGACVCEDDNDTHNYSGATGGSSSFGSLVSVTGGGGGNAVITQSPRTAAGSAGAAGSPNGNAGELYKFQGGYKDGEHTTTGGQGFAASFTKTSGTYGTGGYCTTRGDGKGDRISSASGGSGGYTCTDVSVKGGSTYSIVVGQGGASKCTYWEGKSYTLYNGTAGFVKIAWGGGI